MNWIRFSLRLGFLLVVSVTLGGFYQQMHPASILTSSQNRAESPQQPMQEAAVPLKVAHELVSAVWIEDRPFSPDASGKPVVVSDPTVEVREVTWRQALDWQEKKEASLIDVRARTSYDTGHVPGADSFPIESLAGGMDDLLAKYPDASHKLIFYCSNVRCPQAREAGRILISRHHRKEVFFVPGGFFQWRAENSLQADP